MNDSAAGGDTSRIYKKNQHSISVSSVDEDALKIIKRLERHGYEAYVVGGGVRDLLLSKEPKDFDIATSATPRQIKALFRNCRIIGRRFKLAHIYFRGNKIIEVSTFRDSHDADTSEENEMLIVRDNVYGTVQTDAVRRDLTINALFYDPIQQTIIDHTGGMEDLKAGIVRIIGNPDVRFAEDPVRMIRALRHAARAGFKIDTDCSTSIVQNHDLIEQCADMRLFEELKKDFSSGAFLTILQMLREYRLLGHFLPTFDSDEYLHLWEPGSAFLDALMRIDTAHTEHTAGSVSGILSVFPIFFLFPELDRETILTTRLTQQKLKDALDDVFCTLAVPKKEKEKINLLIRDMQHTLRVEEGAARIKKRSPARDSLRPDKELLLYYLGYQDFPEQRPESGSKRGRRSGGRKRRRHSRGRGDKQRQS